MSGIDDATNMTVGMIPLAVGVGMLNRASRVGTRKRYIVVKIKPRKVKRATSKVKRIAIRRTKRPIASRRRR